MKPDAHDGTDWHLVAALVAIGLVTAFLAHIWNVKP